jgi:hypothetical protein
MAAQDFLNAGVCYHDDLMAVCGPTLLAGDPAPPEGTRPSYFLPTGIYKF